MHRLGSTEGSWDAPSGSTRILGGVLLLVGLMGAACGKLLPTIDLSGSSSGAVAVDTSTTSGTPDPTSLDGSSAGATSSGTTQTGSESSSTGSSPVCGNGQPEIGEVCFEIDVIEALGGTQTAVTIGDVLGEGGYPDLITNRTMKDIRIFQGGPEGLDPNPVSRNLGTDLDILFIRGLAAGDWTVDGRDDLVVPDTDMELVIFSDIEPDPPAGLAVPSINEFFHLLAGDINGDSIPDLVAGTNAYQEFRVFLGTGDPLDPLTPRQLYNPLLTNYDPSLADVDGDGDAELFLATRFSSRLEIYPGNGDDFLTMPQMIDVDDLFDVAIGNFDGMDGLELAVSRFSTEETITAVTVLTLQDGMTYDQGQERSMGPGNPRLLGSADFNNDGLDDLVSTQIIDDTNYLVISTSMDGESFELGLMEATDPRQPGLADGGDFLRVADINLDGVSDVVLITLSSRIITLMSNP